MNISELLHNPSNRMALARALAARGNHGDTVLAHINPQEAALLKARGGVGTQNPRTGLLQFWEDGGGAGNSAGADSGHQGNGNGGGNNGGNSNGGDGNQGSGGYTGTHASGPGFGSGPVNSPSGGYGQYGSNGGYNGGITVNPGRSLVSLGLGMIPGIGPILSGANSMFGPTIGPSLNIGGTTNGYSISGDKTGVYGLGFGGGGPSNVGNNVGQNGGGQHNGGWTGGNQAGQGMSIQQLIALLQQAQGQQTPPAPQPPATPSLAPVMSQNPGGNLIGNAYGNVPAWAQNPYQIGTAPTSYPVPQFGFGKPTI